MSEYFDHLIPYILYYMNIIQIPLSQTSVCWDAW